MLTEISIPFPTQPIHIAFEHLSLYIQKHLSQSVTVRGKVDNVRLCAKYSQVQPGTARYRQVKAGMCYIFEKQVL